MGGVENRDFADMKGSESGETSLLGILINRQGFPLKKEIKTVTTIKLDLTKEYKTYYTAKTAPEVVEFYEAQFLTIEGEGAPGSKEFSVKIEALYPIAYGVKNLCKKQGNDFGVPKLENLWWIEYDKPALEVPREEW